MEYVLMGDIKSSRSKNERVLQENFHHLIDRANTVFGSALKSPLTITLGDEFQGIPESLESSIDIIFHLEEELLLIDPPFEMRYVCVYGAINTPINREIAHGMMGSALSEARELLTRKSRSRPKYLIKADEQDEMRNRLFEALEGIQSHWKKDDYNLIYRMIHESSDAKIGEEVGKHRTQIWKFRKKYLISAYQNLKAVIRQLNHTDYAGLAADSGSTYR